MGVRDLRILCLTVLLLAGGSALAQSTSPGKLAKSHADLDSKCGKCHAPGKGVSDPLCLKCHREAGTSRYHGRMAKRSGKPCWKCHRDHRGREFPMIRWKPGKRFDHRKTGWKLREKHAKLACSKCHALPDRWVGLRSRCASCHDDPHRPPMQQACSDCHGERQFAPADVFSHDDARFKLYGAHRGIDCGKCHPGKRARRKWRGLKFSECSDCHDEPIAGHGRGDHCGACHRNRAWRPATEPAGRRLHNKLRFHLTGKHRPVACAKCHRARRKPASTTVERLRQFRGLRGVCADCHQDPHRGRLGLSCDDCHTPDGWRRGRRKDRGFDHNKTRYPLRGRHRRVSCEACHGGRGSFKKRYKSIKFHRCANCHEDPHPGRFASVQPDDRCEACHTLAGFPYAGFPVAAHERARFPLRGAHRVVPCRSCHKPDPRSGAGRRIARLIGAPRECRGCHEDPHGGQFDGRKPALDCTSCHGDRTFRDPARFDHDKTRFALEGPHKKARCAACHTRPAPGRPVRFAGLDTRCTACHIDIHRGQFLGAGPVKECTDCHPLVDGFRIAKFDHDAKTRFPLRGQHRDVPCLRCHDEVQGSGGRDSLSGRGRRGTPQLGRDRPGTTKAPLQAKRGPGRPRSDSGAEQATTLPGVLDSHGSDSDRGIQHARSDHEPVVLYRMGPMRCERCHANPHERPGRPGGGR